MDDISYVSSLFVRGTFALRDYIRVDFDPPENYGPLGLPA